MTRDYSSVLAFDFGEKRIGVAKGQTISDTAEPLKILDVHNGKIDWDSISNLIDEWQPNLLVVGMPTNYEGEEFGIAERVKRFCRQLKGRYHLPVQTINENLSSVEAKQRLGEKATQEGLDAIAAQVILETWFQEQKN
ncbi:MAG: Holliday junction resolvase RuvX [Gammaproteobacteria bacterium]